MIKFTFKDEFSKLERRAAKAEARVLYKSGGYVRQAARRNIRKAGKKRGTVSQPGEPPRYHVTEPNLRTVEFQVDKRRATVTVGPIKFGSQGRAVGKTIPQVLEEGGTTIVKRTNGDKHVVRIAARSYMQPAFEKSQKRILELFRDFL